MKTITFNTFYSQSQQQIIDFAELAANPEQYRHDIFCPDCKQAKLHYNAGSANRSAHLKTNSSSQHHPNCAYNFEHISVETAQIVLKELSPAQVESKLATALRYLKNQSLPKNANSAEREHITDVNQPILMTHKSKQYALPTKSLATPFDSELVNQPFLFYGKVILTTNEYPSKKGYASPYYFLRIKSTAKRGQCPSLFRSSFKDDIIEGATYNFAVFGYYDIHKNLQLIEQNNCYLQFELCE